MEPKTSTRAKNSLASIHLAFQNSQLANLVYKFISFREHLRLLWSSWTVQHAGHFKQVDACARYFPHDAKVCGQEPHCMHNVIVLSELA